MVKGKDQLQKPKLEVRFLGIAFVCLPPMLRLLRTDKGQQGQFPLRRAKSAFPSGPAAEREQAHYSDAPLRVVGRIAFREAIISAPAHALRLGWQFVDLGCGI